MVCVVSTLGAPTALQTCSGAMRGLVGDGGHLFTDAVQKSVNNAYTRMNWRSATPRDGSDQGNVYRGSCQPVDFNGRYQLANPTSPDRIGVSEEAQ